jgi:quinol monooxygenase YgiN
VAVTARSRRFLVLIAIVDFSTAATGRPAALAQLDGERGRVRAMPGNLAFRVYASREDDLGVSVMHEWEDEASLDGYLRSDVFARLGEVLRPMMSGKPVSRRFRAQLLETVA